MYRGRVGINKVKYILLYFCELNFNKNTDLNIIITQLYFDYDIIVL